MLILQVGILRRLINEITSNHVDYLFKYGSGPSDPFPDYYMPSCNTLKIVIYHFFVLLSSFFFLKVLASLKNIWLILFEDVIFRALG